MKRLALLILVSISLLSSAQDKRGCDTIEPKYMTRMPGFLLENCDLSEFSTYKFSYIDLKDKRIYKEVAGRFYHLRYSKIKGESRKFSGEQIRFNYHNAVVKAKGSSLSLRKDFFKMNQNGRTVWFKIDNAEDADDQGFDLFIVETEEMKQDIEVNMSEGIDRDGKIALYGILFDVGKSVIKPESAPALQMVIDYLIANPGIKIYVVGHTDNTGLFASNITLSKARAKAVKDYLVTKGKIAATRLGSDGVGSLCPVATNATEEGKALNRRVEIVKQ
ncbi:MAG TPA: OmpA family protein [Chitinophagaceae bacterium]|nr:OmpA family protein [Chitinophagaceae bacterium]